MADTVTVDNGALTDYTVASDDVSVGGSIAGQVQFVKLVDGTLNGTDPIPGGANGLLVDGSVAHDAADAGSPHKIGGVARTANGTAVANGDRVNAAFDDVGRQIIIQNAPRDLVVQNSVTLSSTAAETTLLAAGAAGVFHDITCLILSNTSGTPVRLDFRDATAGSVIFSIYLAANGGGAVIKPPVPLTQTTAANNWTIQASASVVDIRAFVQAVKNV